MGWFPKRFAAPVAAVAILVFVSAARADEVVTYYVTGTFGGSGSFSNGSVAAGTNFQSSTVSDSGVTITFRNDNLPNIGSGNHSVLLFPDANGVSSSFADFGNFAFSGSGTSTFDGTTFDLSIFHEDPAVPGTNGQVLDATLHGTIRVVSNVSGSQLRLTFGVTSVTITPEAPSYVYSLRNLEADASGNLNTIVIANGGTISGQITAIPLPATASTGFGLLAGLSGLGGLAKFRRWFVGPVVAA